MSASSSSSRPPGSSPAGRDRPGAWVLALVAAMVAGVAAWWWVRERQAEDLAIATAEPSAQPPASKGRRSDRGRALQLGAAERAPIHLGEAEVVDVAADQIGPLEGQVVSSTSEKGISQAKLSFAAGDELYAVSADQQGRFRFQPPRVGLYELAVVTAEGYLPFAPEWGHSPLVFVARKGRSIRGAKVVLVPAITYRGVVVDPEGQGVAGAEVRLLGPTRADLALASIPDHYVSDPEGRFEFFAPDGANLEARREGYGPGRARVDFAVQVSHQLTIRLAAEDDGKLGRQAIRGTVLGPDDEPVPDALVVARYQVDDATDLSPKPDARDLTDERGRFELSGLDEGSHVVVASSPGYAPAKARDVVAPAEGLLLKLVAGGGLQGVVRDAETGQPVVSFVAIVAQATGGIANELVTVESTFDPEGEYEVAALPPGSYLVTVSARGYAVPEQRQVTITEGEDATADFDLSRGGRIRGVVLDVETKEPLEGARASLEGPGPEAIPLRATATTDEQGQFELAGIGYGEQSVLVAAADHHGRVVGGLHVQPGADPPPITVMLTPTEPGEEPHIELAGIGAVLRAKDDVLVIAKVIPEGGAAEAGLVPGDAIVAVDGQPVVQLGFQGSIHKIRGPEGTMVRLTIQRPDSDEAVVIDVPRRKIKA